MNERVFPSRRNRVWLEGGIVYKQILPQPGGPDPVQTAQAEFDALRRLSAGGVPVPKPLGLDGGLLAMEYIQGVTLVEAIERAETEGGLLAAETLAERLAQWFASFYAACPGGVCRGDVNGRNFLLTPDDRLYGVDFEVLPPGRKETDLGRLTAFALTYDPPRTAYKQRLSQALTRRFTELFGLDPAAVHAEHERELAAMRLRRAKNDKTPT